MSVIRVVATVFILAVAGAGLAFMLYEFWFSWREWRRAAKLFRDAEERTVEKITEARQRLYTAVHGEHQSRGIFLSPTCHVCRQKYEEAPVMGAGGNPQFHRRLRG